MRFKKRRFPSFYRCRYPEAVRGSDRGRRWTLSVPGWDSASQCAVAAAAAAAAAARVLGAVVPRGPVIQRAPASSSRELAPTDPDVRVLTK